MQDATFSTSSTLVDLLVASLKPEKKNQNSVVAGIIKVKCIYYICIQFRYQSPPEML